MTHRFKVGQHVRIVLANLMPRLVGREAIIVAIVDGDALREYAISVEGESWLFGALEYCLAPIDDDSRDPASWEQCVWRPKAEVS